MRFYILMIFKIVSSKLEERKSNSNFCDCPVNDIKNIEKIKIKFFIAAKIFINDIILK